MFDAHDKAFQFYGGACRRGIYDNLWTPPAQGDLFGVGGVECTNLVLLDLGPDVDPRAVVADKGYDAKTNREAARKRGICPVIPYRSNTIDKPKFFAKVLYKARARIEQMMGKIKRFKRIALRCEKTSRNYASFLALVCGFILIKSVHAA